MLFNLKPYYLLVCFVLLWQIPEGISQTRDYRTRADYHPETGLLQSKFTYYHDYWSEQEVIHGRYSEWNKQSVLILDCFYKEGKLDSLCRKYDRLGNVVEVSWWEAGERNGMTQYYASTGGLMQELKYDKGDLNGVAIEYRKNGSLKSVGTYGNNLLQGPLTLYNRKGRRTKQLNYTNGYVMSHKTFSKKGKTRASKKKTVPAAPPQQEKPLEPSPEKKKESKKLLEIFNPNLK